MLKRYVLGFLVLSLAGLLVYGCGQTSEKTAGYAAISGTIYAADGATPLAGVHVWTTGSIIETYTKADGTWTLTEVPLTSTTQTKTVYAESGSWQISFDVDLTVDETATVPASDTTFSQDNLTESVDLAVIPGSYDMIENIIADLGFTYTIIGVSDLNNYAYISTFEAIFINCGADSTGFGVSTMATSGETNLKRFVEEAGGSLYASDWAAEFVERVWPAAIDFYGAAGNSSTVAEDVNEAMVGVGNTSVEAVVENEIVRNYVLSRETASIFYDLDYWVVISAEGTGTDVLLRGTPEVDSTAYGVSALSGRGREVAAAGVKASSILNLSNSPLAVMFQPAGATKGTVLYTTFHNEANVENVSADALKLLKYIIMSL